MLWLSQNVWGIGLGLLGASLEARPDDTSGQIVAIKFFLKEFGSNLGVRLNVKADFWMVCSVGETEGDSCIVVKGAEVGSGCWVVFSWTSVWSTSKRSSLLQCVGG